MARLNTAVLEFRDVSDDFEPPTGLAVVSAFMTLEQAESAGLVLLAMGCPYWLMVHGQDYVVCVRTPSEQAARKELQAWSALGASRPRPEAVFPELAFGYHSFVAYAAVLVLVFTLQARWELIDLGQVDAVAMLQDGAWWRALTALTLHADIVHLMSNLVAGVGFMCLVARYFGAAVAWLLVLLAGIAGNALNAWIHYPGPHLSIGASTGVFAALGVLTGVGLWTALKYPDHRFALPKWLLPAMGGFTLLGLLGLGDGSVDVAAHISGFICGIILGLFAAACNLMGRKHLQFGSMVLIWCLLFGAWAWSLLAAAV